MKTVMMEPVPMEGDPVDRVPKFAAAEELADLRGRVLNAFSIAFQLSYPGQDEAACREVVLGPAEGRTSKQIWEERAKVAPLFADFFLAVGESHLAESVEAETRGELSSAWHSWSEACFWAGVLASHNDKTIAVVKLFDRAVRAAGAKGGNKKSERQAPLRVHALHLLADRRPRDGWKSADAAAGELLSALESYSKKNKLFDLKPTQGTLADWFRRLDAEDFSRMFRSSKRTKGTQGNSA